MPVRYYFIKKDTGEERILFALQTKPGCSDMRKQRRLQFHPPTPERLGLQAAVQPVPMALILHWNVVVLPNLA